MYPISTPLYYNDPYSHDAYSYSYPYENYYYTDPVDRLFDMFQPPFGPPGQGQPGGPPPFGPPGQGQPSGPPSFGPPGQGQPGGPPPFAPPGQGQQAGPPTAPPPSFIPQEQVSAFAVDPGGIARCLFRYTYVWLRGFDQFWFYPIFVGRTSVAGWRWTGFRWVYFGISLRQIQSFTCF
ncbi:hypothetical protein [Neobacillus dielmonensis]|uniref:hypothetical protein n=1 Tax=Neobacillus dielmonensis TaxID=1347369 RepID=UPI0005A877E9|nr:hypothetical protein [Neobacillus dielmonensis]